MAVLLLSGCAHQQAGEVKPEEAGWDGRATLKVGRPDDSLMTYTKFTAEDMPVTAVHKGGNCYVKRPDPKSLARFMIFWLGKSTLFAVSTIADCVEGPKSANLAVNYEGKSYYLEFDCK